MPASVWLNGAKLLKRPSFPQKNNHGTVLESMAPESQRDSNYDHLKI
jgi:hypothetical protein